MIVRFLVFFTALIIIGTVVLVEVVKIDQEKLIVEANDGFVEVRPEGMTNEEFIAHKLERNTVIMAPSV
jgi:hypothetical protein